MAFDVNNPYFRTKVMTATPEQLRMMLLEGALQFMRDGREGLAARNYEKSYDGFSQAKAIILELMNALKPEVAPELCARLQALYVYIFRLLTEGS
ncbi:MAG: flagellar protein FliS, partial [Phycisphaerales bacterium]|nr:flagellar protein FliS [Phycisphaerales bacterium]